MRRRLRENLLLILFLTLIVLQFLTLRALVGVRADLDSIYSTVASRSSCGGPSERACQVTIIPR
jgi:hypothetical protein